MRSQACRRDTAVRGRAGGCESNSGHTFALQGRNLVLHQGDERRNDERRTGSKQRRDLVADRLARSRRENRDHVAAGSYGRDDFGLAVTKGGVAERGLENLNRTVGW